jgi:predicted GNAT family acetyltransferase
MKTEIVSDPTDFRRRAAPLLADEARHNLILGILGTLISAPDVYPERRLFLVTDESGPQCAAVMTPPYNLILADTPDPKALSVLIEALLVEDLEMPGVIGNQPTIDRFVGEWRRITGGRADLQMEQGVFVLTEVSGIVGGPGMPRPGEPADQRLLEQWMRTFIAEALPDEPFEEERQQRAIARRLSGEGPNAYWLWEDDGEVVSWSGHGNPTGRGIRIGPVYTPRALRGRGYATALVAAQSQWLLDNGYEYCFLYTDLANPTSNAIYERIGYRKIAVSAVYGLGAPNKPESAPIG